MKSPEELFHENLQEFQINSNEVCGMRYEDLFKMIVSKYAERCRKQKEKLNLAEELISDAEILLGKSRANGTNVTKYWKEDRDYWLKQVGDFELMDTE